MRTLNIFLVLFVLAVLVACGGSGGSSNNGLKELDLGSTGLDPQKINSPKLEKPSGEVRKDTEQFLENLKKQHYNSNIKVVELPADEEFSNVENSKIKGDDDIYYPLPVDIAIASDPVKKKNKGELPLLVANLSTYFYLESASDDTYKFNTRGYFSYRFGLSDFYFGAFFRLGESGWSIEKLFSNKEDVVFHLYEDQKTLGLVLSTGLKIRLEAKNSTTGELKNIQLEFNGNSDLYQDDFGDKGIAVDSSSGNGSANMATEDSSSSESTGTNNQVDGVDERDSVKRINNKICFVRNTELVGYEIDTGEEITYKLDLDFDAVKGGGGAMPEADMFYAYYFERYLHVVGDSLVVLASDGVSLKVYFFSVGDSFELKSTYEFEGVNVNSRVIDDKLLLIFGDSIYPKKSLEGLHHFAFTEQQKEKLEALNEIKLAGLTLADFNINPSFSVTKNGVLEKSTFVLENNINFVENSGGSFLAYMSVFDAEGVIKNNTLVALDHIENMYVTKDALYMYMTDWQSRTMWWDAIWSASQNTKIYAFDFKGDKIEYYGAGEMEGSLNNPFSLHATGDYLIGATNSFGADNKMISLKRENGDLNVVSTIEGIAEGERIQSVRFIGERAYVVTFLQVDPLFTVDISNPENLLLTGELKITGFSEYLHSIYDGVLLGVGRAGDDNGATNNGKISTFDVSDDHNPTEIESAEFSGEYNSSYMQFAVGYEHHSFTWANWLGMAGLIGHESGKEFLYLAKINEQGALLGFAKLDGNTKIDYWSGGSRSMFIGNTLYYIQSGKVIKYEIDSIEFVTKSSDLKKAKAN